MRIYFIKCNDKKSRTIPVQLQLTALRNSIYFKREIPGIDKEVFLNNNCQYDDGRSYHDNHKYIHYRFFYLAPALHVVSF